MYVESKRQVLLNQKICQFYMFINAVCFSFLIKLQWPKNKRIYDKATVYNMEINK